MNNNLTNVKRSVALRKENLVKILGGKCCICGFNTFITALEFHHVDPSQKSFSFTGNGLMKNLPEQLKELKKCILVCANCHRGIHYHNLKVPQNWQDYFSNEIAEEILKIHSDKTQKHYFYCSECGKQTSKRNVLCPDCANKKRQLTERPPRDNLKFLIRNNSFLAIGRQFGVSDNTIRKWCIAYNLPSKVSEIKKISDQDWEMI